MAKRAYKHPEDKAIIISLSIRPTLLQTIDSYLDYLEETHGYRIARSNLFDAAVKKYLAEKNWKERDVHQALL